MHRYQIASSIAEHGVVAVVREKSADRARHAVASLIEAGQIVVEISTTTPGALDVVHEFTQQASVLIGVGTVLDETTARLAALAGARFVVAPSLDPDVLRTAHRYGMASLPGAATPTEVLMAASAGADFVKLFPASAFGPGSVRDMLAAMPQIALVPTGGVSMDNASDYLRAGAVAVGMGSALTAGSSSDVKTRLAKLLRQVGEVKEEQRL